VQAGAEIEVLCRQAAATPMPPPRLVPVPPAAPTLAIGVPRDDDRSAHDPSRAAQGGRAAELVERLRRLSGRESQSGAPVLEPKPPTAHSPPASMPGAIRTLTFDSAVPWPRRSVAHLCGVRRSHRGVRFIQPSSGREAIFVAGDFNHWSPTATRLEHNPALGIAEVVVPMLPGRHAYRLVIDGRWQADPYNDRREPNEHGEYNSVVVAPEREMVR
jgi:hypothetical protein